MKNLTKVYLSLPLSEVQQTINNNDQQSKKKEDKEMEQDGEQEGEGEALIVGMIERGEIGGGVDKKKEIVRFGEVGVGGGRGEKLEEEMKKTMELGRRMKEVTVGVMGSEAYFSAKMKEKQMGEFGGPSQY